VEVGAERFRDVLREERGQGLAGDPADDFANEKPLGDRALPGQRVIVSCSQGSVLFASL
jgi:hypothetical protein